MVAFQRTDPPTSSRSGGNREVTKVLCSPEGRYQGPDDGSRHHGHLEDGHHGPHGRAEDELGEQLAQHRGGAEAWLTRGQGLASSFFAKNNYLKKHRHEIKEHHMYEGEDASTKMMHLMHSDTMVVVVALIVMICVGLLFRSLCLR